MHSPSLGTGLQGRRYLNLDNHAVSKSAQAPWRNLCLSFLYNPAHDPSGDIALLLWKLELRKEMEVVGAVASFIAIGQALSTARHVAHIARAIPGVENEMRWLQNEVCDNNFRS